VELDELKRLAGIASTIDHKVVDGVKYVMGSKEWFERPANNYQMPTGFRGRKK
jgi:hypothetical protein